MSWYSIGLGTAIIIPSEEMSYTHIPEPPGGNSDAPVTLCGWTGTYEIVSDAQVTCPDCLRVAHYCQQLPQVRLLG